MIDPRLPHQRRAWRTDEEWTRLRARFSNVDVPPTISLPRRIGWLAAAAIILLAGTWAAVAHGTRTANLGDAPIIGRAETATGERRAVKLPDGTIMTLGPASSARFNFSEAIRAVELTGVAGFVVTHESRRRFIVRARNAVTSDIGTEFVVRAYATDPVVRVAVVDGAVSLSSSVTPARAVVLRAGDVGVVRVVGAGATGASLDSTQRVAAYTAWMSGRLVFVDQSLAAVAPELSRWFGVDLRLASPSLGSRRMTAIYAAPTLDGTLRSLAATMHLKYSRVNRMITLTEQSSR